MKRKIIFFFPILLVVLFFLFNPALAKEESKNFVVSKDEIINHDYLASGESVTISGTVNGDVYVLAGNLMFDGKINGDLLAITGTFNFLGEVSDDIRVASGDTFFNGRVGRNLTLAGGNLILTRQAKIGGSVLALGSYLDLQSPVGKDVQIFARRAVLNNQINGNLFATAEKLNLNSETQIFGDFDYRSPEMAIIDQQATISGKTSYQPAGEIIKLNFWQKIKKELVLGNKFLKAINLYLEFFSFLISLVLGLLFIHFFPKKTKLMMEQLTKRFWPSFGLGFLVLLLFIPSIFALVISLVGIPFIFILIPLFFFLAYLSRVFTAFFIGDVIAQKLNFIKNNNCKMLMGLLIYYLLRLIPIVRSFTLVAFVSLGLGAFFSRQKSLQPVKK